MLTLKQQTPIFLVGGGHGATHWIAAFFYVLLPYLTQDLGISYAQAGIFVALFHISSFVTNFASGPVVDLSGRRVLYQIVSLLLGAFALFVFGLSNMYWLLCAMVMLIGASNNLWHPAAISFLSSRYEQNRGYALSIHALGASVGDALAPLAAGSLLLFFTWQGTAMVGILPVLVLTVVFFVFLLPQEAPAGKRGKQGLSLSAYLAGMRMLVRQKAVLSLCLMSSLRSGAQQSLIMFLPLYLVNELKTSPVVMGATIMTMHIAGLIISPVAGIVSDRIGRRPVVLAGLSATTVMIFILIFINNSLIFAVGISILGFALFAVRPVIHSWMMEMAPKEMAASATSLLFGAQSVMNALIPLLGGFIADIYGLPAVFYLIAASMLCANILVFLLPRNEPGIVVSDTESASAKS